MKCLFKSDPKGHNWWSGEVVSKTETHYKVKWYTPFYGSEIYELPKDQVIILEYASDY